MRSSLISPAEYSLTKRVKDSTNLLYLHTTRVRTNHSFLSYHLTLKSKWSFDSSLGFSRLSDSVLYAVANCFTSASCLLFIRAFQSGLFTISATCPDLVLIIFIFIPLPSGLDAQSVAV